MTIRVVSSKQFLSGTKSYYYESEHISLFHNGLPNINPYNETMPFKKRFFVLFCFSAFSL